MSPRTFQATNAAALLAGSAILAGILLVPSRADAARIPVFFSYGDNVYELFEYGDEAEDIFEEYEDDLIDEFGDADALDGLKVGFMCQHFALFFGDVWTWDCNIVAYDEDDQTFVDLPEDLKEELEDEFSMADTKRGLWTHWGGLIIIGGFIVIVFGGGLSRVFKKKSSDGSSE